MADWTQVIAYRKGRIQWICSDKKCKHPAHRGPAPKPHPKPKETHG